MYAADVLPVELKSLFSKVERPAYWDRLGAWDVDVRRVEARAHEALIDQRALLAERGFAVVTDLVTRAEATDVAMRIEALRADGVPPVFGYAIDNVWSVGHAIARGASASLGASYELLSDGWVFWIEPKPGRAGWAPHRGSTVLGEDRLAPDDINAWLALTDVTIDGSCMYVTPLDEDPLYPTDLTAPASEMARARGRALPVEAGTLLVWNANALHWGGAMRERATTPRVSITFTARRADASAGTAPDEPAACTAQREPGDLRARLDEIARFVLTYEGQEPDFPLDAKLWARWTERLPDELRRRGARA